jgi:transcriptional regulator with XRE-family HTH domain
VSFVEFGQELKRRRRARRATQQQVAQAVAVSRPTFAQWETGKHLPSTGNARLLDDYLGAGNALFDLAESARSPLRPRTVSVTSPPTGTGALSLLQVFHKVGAALMGYLIRDEEGTAAGWRHNLQKEEPHTALSTAYGIKAMLLAGEPSHFDLAALERSLRRLEKPDGGWSSTAALHASRPETTATVLDAMFRVGTSMPVDDALSLLERPLGEFSKSRPFVLATVLQTVLRLRPDSPFATSLIDDLLAARRYFGGMTLWPEKLEPGLALQEPSPVHTAHAVVALNAALETHDRADLREAVTEATTWLVHQEQDGAVTEELTPPGGYPENARIPMRHFTSAWVTRALVSSPLVPIPLARTQAALKTLWSRYAPEHGLWAWDNGDLPIWMTHDAVAALHVVSRALFKSPVRDPPPS